MANSRRINQDRSFTSTTRTKQLGIIIRGGLDFRGNPDQSQERATLGPGDGEVVTEKVLTTPDAPLEAERRGIGAALRKASASGNNISPADITAPIVHATTLVTNALIEGCTAKAALVTTKGFGDTLLIRDEHRYDMYDLQIEFAEPPIPRERTVEIDERTLAAPGEVGEVLRTPSSDELDAVAAQLREMEVEAVAICFLHSYANGHNEQVCAEHLRDMALDASLAEEAAAKLAGDLGLSVSDVAAGIHEVVNQNTAVAARMHAVEKGTDLRDTPLIAFGGPGQCMPAGWPSCWKLRRSSFLAMPGCFRLSARLSRPCSSIWHAPCRACWEKSTQPSETPCSAKCESEGEVCWLPLVWLPRKCASAAG